MPTPQDKRIPCLLKLIFALLSSRSCSNITPPTQPPCHLAPSRPAYGLGGKTAFQSFFMLMTIQPCCFASAMRASLKVPIFESGP